MNTYMRDYIQTAINFLNSFETSLKAAAMQDDGKFDKQERKTYNRICKLTDRYKEELEYALED